MVYLQITLNIAAANRAAAAGIYQQYKAPFLNSIAGAQSKQLLLRDDDVQVLHGFDTVVVKFSWTLAKRISGGKVLKLQGGAVFERGM